MVLRSFLPIVLLLLPILLTACGGEMAHESEPRGSDSPITPDCPEASSPPRIASIVDLPSGPIEQPRTTSWVAYATMADLAWASHVIVRGTVAADCPSNEKSEYFPPEDPDLVIVDVQTTYRGESQAQVAVAKNADPWGAGSSLILEVGDDVALFLSSEAQTGHVAWLVGGPQGLWRVSGDRVSPVSGTFPALVTNEFPAAIATALRGEVPPTTLQPISLDQSSPGPDLPLESDTVVAPAGCGGEIASTSGAVEQVGQLAWVSHQVVIGTVIERRQAIRLDEPSPEADPELRPVVTDFIVEVDERFRGSPGDTVVVRRLGGEVDGCLVTNTDGPTPEIGERVLLFLWSPEPDISDAIFYVSGGGQGLWRLGESGYLAESHWPLSEARRMILSLGDLVARIDEALAGEPNAIRDGQVTVVPVELTPISDVIVPALEPGSDWVQETFAGDFFVHYPPGWTVFEGEDGSFSLQSWPATESTTTFPDGEMRVDLRELPDRVIYEGDPHLIRVAGMPGLIQIDAAHDDIDPAPAGRVWFITVTWGNETTSWEARATFSERPTLENPNTLTFFTVLAGIQR